MCFQPKVKTPQVQTQYVAAAPIAPATSLAGIQYGGQDDVADGMSEATVDKSGKLQKKETAQVNATNAVNPNNPSVMSNTQVTTEETAPTKFSKLKQK